MTTDQNSSANIIDANLAWHYQVVEKSFINGELTLFVGKNNIELDNIKEELELIKGCNVFFDKVEPDYFQQLLKTTYQEKTKTDLRQKINYYHGEPDNFLNDLISETKNLRSSDIHIESYEDNCRVRIRVDGLLVLRYLIEKKQYPSLINKIKITANMDIAEKRLPQDGRIFFQKNQQKFDIRVSIIPTLYGEKVVLRLLSNETTNIDLNTLGFSKTDLYNYLESLKKPYGIILISGPTGSGKTTTLYATLKLLNNNTKNILTIEDPIEYTLHGINQVQVKDNIGLTFASALKNFLRQDPDIIMLGEIRDSETANMAIRAALTGHLVLSTIHTNSAWGTISRLIDMGIPPFLIANTLTNSMAQRLIRLLCPSCKQKIQFDPSLFPKKYKPQKKIDYHYIPCGCTACFNTGYKGRKAVFEVIPIDEDFGEEIKNASGDVSALLKTKKIRSLSENAFDLFENGETSLEEIYPLLLS